MNHRLALVTALALCALAPASATAQDWPKGFTCWFNKGASQAYGKGRFRSRPAKALTFEIGAIDLDKQSAELVTKDGGQSGLRIVRALGANHFLEVVTEGYLNMTTIYQMDSTRKAFPAVHSRHFGLFGEPLIAQYTGLCLAK